MTAAGDAAYASVVLTEGALVHQDRTFTYRIPDGMTIRPGARVAVPFHRKRRQGVVVGLLERPDVPRTLPITEPLGPGLSGEVLELALWVGAHYLATPGEAVAAALPDRIASEEPGGDDPPPPVRARSLAWLDVYRGGGALRKAIAARGGGSFSLRPGATRAEELAALAAAVASEGGGVLVLVPEVRVTGETAAAIAALGPAVASLGSDRRARERYREWLRLHAGAARIAVGGRAAVFAPVQDLRLVIVDDEAHVSYKARRAPRFNARPVAHERARRAGAVFLAVGTPPSIEAGAAVERGSLTAVSLPRAETVRTRPPVTVVDRSRGDDRHVPHPETIRAAAAVLASGGRVVFLSHRGGAEARRVASRAFRILQPRRPARLDARAEPEELAAAVRDADCIVATPVIAKDLVVERVGLVAILDTDAALGVPEFRGTEEAFATWWHVGRWAMGGRLIVETAQRGHPAIRALVRWDSDALYRFESAVRRETGYPPFAGMARIDAPAARAGEAAAAVAKAMPAASVLGPLERGGKAVVIVRLASRNDLLVGLAPLAARWRQDDEPFRIDVDPREVLPR